MLESGRWRADLAHVDRRARPGLLVGAVGGGIGIAGALSGNRMLAFGAGLAALGAGVAAAVLAAGWTQAEHDLRRAEADAALPTAEQTEPALPTPPTDEVDIDITPRDSEANRGPESVFDKETGLLDERVFVVSFERKVAAARRHLRPLCLVLVDVGAGLPAHPDERNQALRYFGTVVRDTLRDADIACRLSPTSFGLILEDTPEAGGVWAAERLQIALACQPGGPKRMVAAIATYPNHGLAAQEVLKRAQDALVRARASNEQGMGAVEVASSDHL